MQTMDRVPDQKPLELLIITGTNLGRTTINVKGIFWTLGWFRGTTFVTVPYNNIWSQDLPKEITHSQQVLLAQPLSEFVANLDTFVRYLRGRWYRRFFVRSFRCGLYTSNGDFSSRADSRLRDLVEKAFHAALQPKSTVA